MNQLITKEQLKLKQPIQLKGHNNQIGAVAMSNNGQLMASGDYDGQILLWQLDSKSIKQKYDGESKIQDLIFSHEDKLLAAAQFKFPYDILIFNLSIPSSTSPYIKFQEHSNTVWRIVFTLNSQFLISGSLDETLKTWSLDSQKCVANQKLSHYVCGVNISQNQQYISACGRSGYAYLFNSTNIENLKQITQWNAHQEIAYGTSFTPDSKMLLTCGYKDVKLWSIIQILQTDQEKSPFRVYKTETSVWSVQTKLGGSILISNDEKIRIWNMKSGKLIQTLDVPERYEYIRDQNFSVSKDMKYIITGGTNRNLKVYELNIKQ